MTLARRHTTGMATAMGYKDWKDSVTRSSSYNMQTVNEPYREWKPAMEEINATRNRNVGIPPFNVMNGNVNIRQRCVFETGKYKRDSYMQILERVWSVCALAN